MKVAVVLAACVCALTTPLVNGFRPAVFLHRYSEKGCNLTQTSTVRVSRVLSGCSVTKVTNATSFLRWDGGTNLDNRIQYYGEDCGLNCLNCKTAVHNNVFGQCSNEMQTGATFYPTTWKPCVSKSTLTRPDDVVVTHYSDTHCDLVHNLTVVANISMLYNNVCQVYEGQTKSNWKVAASKAPGSGNTTFTGVMGCTNTDCTSNCQPITAWKEGSCHKVAGIQGSFTIQRYESVHDCSAPAANTSHKDQDETALWVGAALGSLAALWCIVGLVPLARRKLGSVRANVFGYASIEG